MRHDYWILDDAGEPVAADLMTWAEWFEANHRKRIVAKDDVGKSHVSTVFLGIDHSWGNGEPVLWETMVFGGQLDHSCWQYHSREEAVAGHKHVVAMLARRAKS